jgi:rhodanese-related sulfurtransferase
LRRRQSWTKRWGEATRSVAELEEGSEDDGHEEEQDAGRRTSEAMLRGIIGDSPVDKPVILLKPSLIISKRARNWLKQDGLDTVRVLHVSLNHWDTVKIQERKTPKLAKPDGFVKGRKLMTANALLICNVV